MANISFFQNRLSRTDGVSLEVDKWRSVLRDRLGHKVWYCSGNNDIPGNYNISELYAMHPMTWKILRNGTVAFKDYKSEQDLERDIYNHADVIEGKLLKFINEKKIDVLIPHNLCSGGYQPAAAIAFHRVIRKTGLPAIIHCHDFYFEDSGEVRATCQIISSIYERYFPAKLPNVQHVVINRLAQKRLKELKNIDATVVPNVFDFDQPTWTADEYNGDFRMEFGIGKDDLVFLQATRILDRKGIEMAIDVVSEVSRPARRRLLFGNSTAGGGRFHSGAGIILLCSGIVETIGISGDYWKKLLKHAKIKGVDIRYAGDRVKHSREIGSGGKKTYSLWDSYVFADFVTYPSTWEGWGNQFIEAVFAKLPALLFEYPVWRSDIKQAGFDVVSLGSRIAGTGKDGLIRVPSANILSAADQIVGILRDPGKKTKIVENNFKIGRTFFSFDALENKVRRLLKKLSI